MSKSINAFSPKELAEYYLYVKRRDEMKAEEAREKAAAAFAKNFRKVYANINKVIDRLDTVVSGMGVDWEDIASNQDVDMDMLGLSQELIKIENFHHELSELIDGVRGIQVVVAQTTPAIGKSK